MDAQRVASVVNDALHPAVKAKLPGGVIISPEPPAPALIQLAANPIGGSVHEKALQRRYGDSLEKVRAVLTKGLLQGKGIKPIATEVRGVLNKNLVSRATM